MAALTKLIDTPPDPIGPNSVVTTTAARDKPGNRFQATAEAQLVPLALKLIPHLQTSQEEILAVQEMPGPFGIPDLVAVIGISSTLDDRRKSGVPPLLNELDAKIVAALSVRYGSEPEEVAEKLGIPLSAVDRRLPYLFRYDAVTHTGSGGLIRNPVLRPLGRMCAVEIKVNDWRRGIEQLRKYALWTDAAALVMGTVDSSLQEAAEQASHWRLGLAVQDSWIRKPRPRKLTPGRRLWASEHLVAAVSINRSG